MLRRSRAWVESWALWQAPRPVVILVLTVDSVAALAGAATAWLAPIRTDDLVRFGVLAACAWIAIELTRHIERRRVYAHSSAVAYIDTKAVWSFAAVIVLPPTLATAMVVITYSLAWIRVKHQRPGIGYRWIFSCATVLCGTQAAVAVLALGMHEYPGAPGSTPLDGMVDLLVIVAAAALRWSINVGLVMAAIALSNPSATARDLFANFGEQLLEAGAMGLGLVAATTVVTNPFVLPGIVIAMVALHRGILVHQYQQASRFDAKTGLASAGWWHEFAEQALGRARDRGTTLGLLIIDLDHFKNINDTYGHAQGDLILRAVAKEILAEVRDQDACGRWGGEEFVVVLPEVGTDQNLHNVAERIRRRIQLMSIDPPAGRDAEVGAPVTASLGGALYPAEGIATLDELLIAADSALYAAKNAGRNAVRTAGTPSNTAPQQPRSTDATTTETALPQER